MRTEVKMILPMLPLPFLMLALFLSRRGETDPFYLLLWEAMTVFGYYAAYRDIKERIIPNKLVTAMLCVWVLIAIPQLLVRTEAVIGMVFSAVVGFALTGVLLALVYIISHRGIGGGDVKFMTVAGLYLGARGAVSALLYGSILSAITGLLLVAFKKIDLKSAIPLMPFLYVGIMLNLFLM